MKTKLVRLIPVVMLLGFVSQTAVAETATQNPLATQLAAVLQQVQKAILAPFTGMSLNGGGCQPQATWTFAGLDMKFTQSATCKLEGTISLNWFTLAANVDLNVFGVPAVQSLELKASIVLKGTAKEFNAGLQFLDGSIVIAAPWGGNLLNLVMNGNANFQLKGGQVTFTARDNFFDGPTAAGIALQTTLSAAGSHLSMCELTGADPHSVAAGTLANCQGN